MSCLACLGRSYGASFSGGTATGSSPAMIRSSAASIDASSSEPRTEPVGAEALEQLFRCAAVGDAQHRLAERQVLVDLRGDCGLVACAAGLRDQRDVGRGDSFDGVVPARRRDDLDLGAGRRDLGLDLRRDVAVEDEAERRLQGAEQRGERPVLRQRARVDDRRAARRRCASRAAPARSRSGSPRPGRRGGDGADRPRPRA